MPGSISSTIGDFPQMCGAFMTLAYSVAARPSTTKRRHSPVLTNRTALKGAMVNACEVLSDIMIISLPSIRK